MADSAEVAALLPAPALLAVDADPVALGRVERELRDRYLGSYQVICTVSPKEALAILTWKRDAGEEVALVLAGQSFPETTGDELLERVGRLHPHAREGRCTGRSRQRPRGASDGSQRRGSPDGSHSA